MRRGGGGEVGWFFDKKWQFFFEKLRKLKKCVSLHRQVCSEVAGLRAVPDAVQRFVCQVKYRSMRHFRQECGGALWAVYFGGLSGGVCKKC